MTEKSSMKFECKKCGSNKLGYQKGVLCISPVAIQSDNHIEYSQFKMGEDDSLCIENSFLCVDCNNPVSHCGCTMETEKQLLAYLTKSPEVRATEQQDYEERLKAQDEVDRTTRSDEMFDFI